MNWLTWYLLIGVVLTELSVYTAKRCGIHRDQGMTPFFIGYTCWPVVLLMMIFNRRKK